MEKRYAPRSEDLYRLHVFPVPTVVADPDAASGAIDRVKHSISS
jgi:hypothetical protein